MGEVLKVTQRLPRFCNLFYIFELKVCDGTRFIAIDRIRRRVKKIQIIEFWVGTVLKVTLKLRDNSVFFLKNNRIRDGIQTIEFVTIFVVFICFPGKMLPCLSYFFSLSHTHSRARSLSFSHSLSLSVFESC